jgi:hypothetical protein
MSDGSPESTESAAGESERHLSYVFAARLLGDWVIQTDKHVLLKMSSRRVISANCAEPLLQNASGVRQGND